MFNHLAIDASKSSEPPACNEHRLRLWRTMRSLVSVLEILTVWPLVGGCAQLFGPVAFRFHRRLSRTTTLLKVPACPTL
jgi:hypothetical protein